MGVAMMTWLAVTAYLATAMACGGAALSAARPPRGVNHAMAWAGIAALFLALAAIRATDADSLAGAAMRALLTSEGDYGARQKIQAPFASTVILVGFAFVAAGVYYRPALLRRYGRRLFRALAASAAMIGLVALRAVSLHATDAMLYAGPVHPNWIVDLGLTAAVAINAWQTLRAPPKARKR
jgi:hypothetical protein